jgi:CheY-like chemotaxis protein
VEKINMKLLIVEDESDFVTALIRIVKQFDINAEITVAVSRDGALEKISDEFFDLLLIDLMIPTVDGALDGDPVHGHSVFRNARVNASGTPVIVLTGSSAEEFIPSLVEHSSKTDVWGSGTPNHMVTFHQKHKLDSFPSVFKLFAEQILKVKEVEIKRNGVDLSLPEQRLVRIFARKMGGTKLNLSEISGGLSGSRVLRLRITGESGSLIHDTICKIGSQEAIKEEDDRFSKHISRLPPEATPRKLDVLEHGAKKTSGVFYSLAESFDLNAFDGEVLNKSPTELIKQIENFLSRWATNVESRRQIAEIRRRLMDDVTYQKFSQDIQWADAFERNVIQVKWGCAHGDLHGLNVLVSNTGVPTLIDYGDVGDGPSSIDPITLELCLFFHPQAPLKASEWPTKLQAKQWGDLDAYLIGCPYPEFVKACREWALRVAAGDREIAAVAYSYLVRQLKYPEVDKERVFALIEGVMAFYDQT